MITPAQWKKARDDIKSIYDIFLCNPTFDNLRRFICNWEMRWAYPTPFMRASILMMDEELAEKSKYPTCEILDEKTTGLCHECTVQSGCPTYTLFARYHGMNIRADQRVMQTPSEVSDYLGRIGEDAFTAEAPTIVLMLTETMAHENMLLDEYAKTLFGGEGQNAREDE